VSLGCLIFYSIFQFLVVYESLQGEAGIPLESSDQKTGGFMVQIALPLWFLERVHQVFSEMAVRTYTIF
jgi:hypothetical protein